MSEPQDTIGLTVDRWLERIEYATAADIRAAKVGVMNNTRRMEAVEQFKQQLRVICKGAATS